MLIPIHAVLTKFRFTTFLLFPFSLIAVVGVKFLLADWPDYLSLTVEFIFSSLSLLKQIVSFDEMFNNRKK